MTDQPFYTCPWCNAIGDYFYISRHMMYCPYRPGATISCEGVGQVIELPIKHPELLESLGIAQPKLLKMSTSSDPLGLLDPSGENVYKKLANDDEPLYEGCKKFSKYQAALAFYNLKINHNLCDAGFEEFLRFAKSALPRGEKLVGSIDELKKVLEKLGITYQEVSERKEEVDEDSDDSSEDGMDHD